MTNKMTLLFCALICLMHESFSVSLMCTVLNGHLAYESGLLYNNRGGSRGGDRGEILKRLQVSLEILVQTPSRSN